MESLLALIEAGLYLAVVCFPITTLVMIIHLKQQGYDPVGSQVESNWSMNFDLNLFSKIRKGYVLAGGNQFISRINAFFFYYMFAAFAVVFVSGVASSAMH